MAVHFETLTPSSLLALFGEVVFELRVIRVLPFFQLLHRGGAVQGAVGTVVAHGAPCLEWTSGPKAITTGANAVLELPNETRQSILMSARRDSAWMADQPMERVLRGDGSKELAKFALPRAGRLDGALRVKFPQGSSSCQIGQADYVPDFGGRAPAHSATFDTSPESVLTAPQSTYRQSN